MKHNRASLADKAGWAAAHVELPQYDVAAVAEATKKAPTWVHFGTGNIFRAYIAALAQRMLNEGLTDKGLLMANTNDPAILDIAYTPFDNLCIAVTLNPDATTSREIIGSIAEGIKADSSDEAAMAPILTIRERAFVWLIFPPIIFKVKSVMIFILNL